ncbi:MAG: hypothetical protein H0U06_06630, partial [Solirubrobacterales bacterium]|nr:hypothetical protein [Solirubrobacterales bacterium]
MGLILTLVALAMSASLAATARADVYVPADFVPSIWSDKADYAPGELVTLSGSQWGAGEFVHIRVNDDAGSTWSRDVDVTADGAGAISDSFNLPDWFVAEYSVTATGASGSVARTTFTDGNVRISAVNGPVSVKETLYNGQNCSGPIKSGYPKNEMTTASVGVGSSESLTLEAPASGPNGRVFAKWTQPPNGNLAFEPADGKSRIICVAGFGNGSRDLTAVYT